MKLGKLHTQAVCTTSVKPQISNIRLVLHTVWQLYLIFLIYLLSYNNISCLQLLLQISFTLRWWPFLLPHGENRSHKTNTVIIIQYTNGCICIWTDFFSPSNSMEEKSLFLSNVNSCTWLQIPSTMTFPMTFLLWLCVFSSHLQFLHKVTPSDPHPLAFMCISSY